ncbi:MAG: MazG-like family protein [Candidatus Moranbacteria bacterium]|nr:MazG-like family protein [Candidatus Moranbacteria bacterium]
MDSRTTIEEVKELIAQFMKERELNPGSRDLAVSISLKASELLEHFQWSEKGDGDALEIKRALADVMIYCLEFATLNNIDISEAIHEKMLQNEKKYPKAESYNK